MTVAVGQVLTAAYWNTTFEEGSFAPVLKFGGATTGIAYTRQIGMYKRAGNIVFCTIDILLTSKGSASGVATITGLPFTAQNSSYGVNAASFFTFGFLNGPLTVAPIAAVDRNGTTIEILAGNGDGTALSDPTFNNNTSLQIGVIYFV